MITNKQILYTTKDIDNCLSEIDKNLTIEHTCPNCGAQIKFPIIVTEKDIAEFNILKNIIFDFINNHPEIKHTLLKELMDDLLDYYNRMNI